MALIEVEMMVNRFGGLVHMLASAGPIPIGILNGLPGRLMAGITWSTMEIGPSPAGFSTAPGTLTARAAVTLRHVSIADLDADPNAAGLQSNATAWLRISAVPTELRIEVIGIDVAGAAPQLLLAPVRVARRSAAPLLGGLTIGGAAVLLRDEVVTLRFATAASDDLLATPLNVLTSTPNDDWAIRVSGEVLAEQLLATLRDGVDPPPDGTSIEDQPSAGWVTVGASSFAHGAVGLEKKDACPGLFGDVDISVTVNVAMTFTPVVALPTPLLNLQVDISSDASDWDSFRCWLGSGGIAGALLGVINPFIGILVGIGTLVTVGEIVRLQAGSQVAGTGLGDSLTLVSSDDTSARYTGSRPLPTLATPAGGTTRTATVGPSGLIVTGTISYFGAEHEETFNPDGGQLPAALRYDFDCRRRAWLTEADVQGIQIADRARVLTVDLGLVPVAIFNSSVAVPGHLWKIDQAQPSVDQTATIVGANLQAGDTGRVYLHTSAGIRRYDIAALAAVPAPTVADTVAAIASCMARQKLFTPREKILWGVDPPPYDFGLRPLRQWLITFESIPAATMLSVRRVRNGTTVGEPLSLFAEKSGEASIELVSDAETEIIVEHNAERIGMGRVRQRWLLPIRVLPAGAAPTALARDGSKVHAVSKRAVLTLDLHTGATSRQAGDFELAKSAAGAVIAVDRKCFFPGSGPEPEKAGPFSVTLPDGKVVAAVGNDLVVAVPWGV